MLKVNSSAPELAKELIFAANKLGWTEDELCKNLQIIPSTFSRWKNNLRPAPDPRAFENRNFFEVTSRLLGISVGEAIGRVCFAASNDPVERLRAGNVTIASDFDGIGVPKLSPSSKKALAELLVNLSGREPFIHSILSGFRTYVEVVICEDWRPVSVSK